MGCRFVSRTRRLRLPTGARMVMDILLEPETVEASLTVTDASTVSGSNKISITILAPVGSLNLRVLDTNLHPIPQANVTLTRTPHGQQKLSSPTNSLGTAGLTGLRAGGYTVQASSHGYETAMKNVTVVVGQTTNDQLVLAKVPPANSFPWALAGAAI